MTEADPLRSAIVGATQRLLASQAPLRIPSSSSIQIRLRRDMPETVLRGLRDMHREVQQRLVPREAYRTLLASNLAHLRHSPVSTLPEQLTAATAVAEDGLDGVLSVFVTLIYLLAEERREYGLTRAALERWRLVGTPSVSDGAMGAVFVGSRNRLIICDYEAPGLDPPPRNVGELRQWVVGAERKPSSEAGDD